MLDWKGSKIQELSTFVHTPRNKLKEQRPNGKEEKKSIQGLYKEQLMEDEVSLQYPSTRK